MNRDTARQVNRYLTIIMGISAAVLETANHIHEVPGIPGWLSNKSGLVVSIAIIVNALGHNLISKLKLEDTHERQDSHQEAAKTPAKKRWSYPPPDSPGSPQDCR